MKRLLLLLLACLLLCGCQEAEIDPDAVDFSACKTIPIEEVEVLPDIAAYDSGAVQGGDTFCTAENGLFLVKMDQTSDRSWSSEQSFLYYMDLDSGDAHCICAKPNCAHDSYDCSALVRYPEAMYWDGESIYCILGINDNSPGLWRMDPDGTDRREILSIPVGENGFYMLRGVLYRDRTVYFVMNGALPNMESGEMESSFHICIGDLDTGELTILPVRFSDTEDLYLSAMWDDQLVIRHQTDTSNRVETWFLLDVDTREITVIYQSAGDSSRVDGYLRFLKQTAPRVESVYEDGSLAIVFSGDRTVFDPVTRKGYRQTGVDPLVSSERILDGYYLSDQWSEDRSFVRRVLTDLSTGETVPDPRETTSVMYARTIGDDYLIQDLRGDGSRWGLITREDFWESNYENILYMPDWFF